MRGPAYFALMLLVMLPSCAMQGPAPDLCAGWAPIRPMPGETRRLSPELREQVLGHNVHGQNLGCWEP